MTTENITIMGQSVTLDSELKERLMNNEHFQGFIIDDKGYPSVMFSAGETRLVELAVNRPKYHTIKYNDKNKLNVSSSNITFKKTNGKIPSTKREHLKGAYFYPKKMLKKWLSLITVDGKAKHLGYFKTQEEAHNRYLEEARKLGRTT